jgi:hypothetical protein
VCGVCVCVCGVVCVCVWCVCVWCVCGVCVCVWCVYVCVCICVCESSKRYATGTVHNQVLATRLVIDREMSKCRDIHFEKRRHKVCYIVHRGVKHARCYCTDTDGNLQQSDDSDRILM